MLIITNALRPDRPGDIVIEDFAAVGLPLVSKIRAEKISTLEHRHAERIGRIEEDFLADVIASAAGYVSGD
jgi:hypothetical protein